MQNLADRGNGSNAQGAVCQTLVVPRPADMVMCSCSWQEQTAIMTVRLHVEPISWSLHLA